MEAGAAPDAASYPGGAPTACAVGSAVSLTFFIPGQVIEQSRPRGRVAGGKGSKPFVQFYEESKVSDYKDEVARMSRELALAAPVVGDVDFTLPIKESRVLLTLTVYKKKPGSYPKRVVHDVKKPDIDNLAKSIIDGMVRGEILQDDAMITDLTVRKRYADDEHPVGVLVDLTGVKTEVP